MHKFLILFFIFSQLVFGNYFKEGFFEYDDRVPLNQYDQFYMAEQEAIKVTNEVYDIYPELNRVALRSIIGLLLENVLQHGEKENKKHHYELTINQIDDEYNLILRNPFTSTFPLSLRDEVFTSDVYFQVPQEERNPEGTRQGVALHQIIRNSNTILEHSDSIITFDEIIQTDKKLFESRINLKKSEGECLDDLLKLINPHYF